MKVINGMLKLFVDALSVTRSAITQLPRVTANDSASCVYHACTHLTRKNLQQQHFYFTLFFVHSNCAMLYYPLLD